MLKFSKIARSIRKRLPLPSSVICRVEGGYSLELHPASDIWERNLYINRYYERSTLALMAKVLRPGDRMLDIGANIGLMTLHGSKLVGSTGSVVSLEPHPTTYRRLLANIERNGCRNVTPIQAAAGTADDQLEIFDVPSVNIGRSSLVRPQGAHVSAGTVPVRRLDDLIGTTDTHPRTFMKIDVEGFELQVLSGAPGILASQPVICMECDTTLPTVDSDALAPYRLVLETGLYEPFRFATSKSSGDPTLTRASESSWTQLKFENAIFLPKSLISALPAGLIV